MKETTRSITLKDSFFKSDPLLINHLSLKRFIRLYSPKIRHQNDNPRISLTPTGEKSIDKKVICGLSKLEILNSNAVKYICDFVKVAEGRYVPKYDLCHKEFAKMLPEFVHISKNNLSSDRIDPEVLVAYADEVGFIEYISRGLYGFNISNKSIEDACDYTDYNKLANVIPSLLKEYTPSIEDLYTYGIKSPSYRTTCGFKYTFGVEIECSSSFTPTYMNLSFNMSCVRDGSLNAGKGGPEYVTGVLVGDSGMMHLQQMMNYISGRSAIDKFCGNHVHIGGFTPTKEFSLALFLLCFNIQNEIFLMLPVSRRTNEYCRKIPSDIYSVIMNALTVRPEGISPKDAIDAAYDLLVEYVAALDLVGGKDSFLQGKGNSKNEPLGKYLNKNSPHPLGKKCNYNHKTPRYEWLNLVPLLFNEKGKDIFTVEFRPHPASLNFVKMRHWVNLCMAIVSFAETHSARIFSNSSISLETIINSTIKSPLNRQALINYVNDRKTKFAGNLNDTAAKIETVMYSEESFATHEDKTLKELCV